MSEQKNDPRVPSAIRALQLELSALDMWDAQDTTRITFTESCFLKVVIVERFGSRSPSLVVIACSEDDHEHKVDSIEFDGDGLDVLVSAMERLRAKRGQP